MNPLNILTMIKQGQNPQQIMLSLLQQNTNNPMIQNLLQLAQNNDKIGIENIARNILKERGMDFDKEFNSFRKNLRI